MKMTNINLKSNTVASPMFGNAISKANLPLTRSVLSFGLLFMLFALPFSKSAKAQTTVSRTSTIIAGASPFQDSLWTFNTSDYGVVKRTAPTLPGFTITGINAITTHPFTGTHYCILKLSGVSGRVLATIDIQTGVCTQIGNLGDNFATLAFNSNGSLFGVTGNGATVSETMYRINTSDASTTLFRPLGAGADGETIVYCTDNNYFYHWSGNSSVVWERFDTSGTDVIENLTYTAGYSGEVFGGMYLGGGQLLMSNISSTLRIWDTSGNINPVLINTPDDLRGLVRESHTSTISSAGSVGLCVGGSVTLNVTGGVGNYQWYMDGVAISGETNSSYTAATQANYNCTYTDVNGITDSTTTGINVTVSPIPDVNAVADQTQCNGLPTSILAFGSSFTGVNYTWINNNTSIGLAAAGTGNLPSFLASNTTLDTVLATIVVTPVLNGCVGTVLDTFAYIVRPTPTLSSAVTASICNGAIFGYNAFSLVEGTTYEWVRDTVVGITQSPSSASSGGITETLNNNTPNPLAAIYSFTLTAAGCTSTQGVTVSVNPTPVLFPTPLVGSVCSGDNFTFSQNSLTSLATYSWSRAAVIGISQAASSGTGDIDEVLTNTTTAPITVTYVDTLRINGCANNQSVQVVVNPIPVLTSTLTPAGICNNDTFSYRATSATTGTTFAWERNIVAGISNAYAFGLDSVRETLTNTTENPITVPYVFTLTANGCTNIQTVDLSVNPTPVLNTTLTPAAICDSTFFDYTPGSNTTGATFAWRRDTVSNITNPAANGTNNPNERLRNAASYPVAVTYVFTSTINGCSNAQNVVVTVNPKPRLSNTAPTPICDSTIFTFTPTSTTLGTTYAWSRDFIGGIGALPATGGPGINELLKNNTNTNLPVPYVFTLTANGCTNTQTISVIVHPTPRLSSSLSDSACSGVAFVYTPTTTLTPPVTYAWSRASVVGITPINGAGTNGVNETLINATTGNLDVVYTYTITVGASCARTYNVAVKVRPSAEAPIIAIMPSATLCSGAMYQNFGAATMPAAGVTYTWSAINAEVYATGAQNQNALVNFNIVGTATVTLTSKIGATGCIGKANYSVTVGSGAASTPQIIYASKKLICIQGKVKSYQWGYDDANTLDSVALAGGINQSYYIASPETATRNYWVMTTTEDGCTNKAYYNKPADNTPRIADNTDSEVTMNVFPNPAYNTVTVELSTAVAGTMRIDVANMLGQVVSSTNADTHTASINVASLPAGIYVIDCYVEGVKVGAAKFVKN